MKIGINELYEIENSKKGRSYCLVLESSPPTWTPLFEPLWINGFWGPQLPPPIHNVNYPLNPTLLTNLFMNKGSVFVWFLLFVCHFEISQSMAPLVVLLLYHWKSLTRRGALSSFHNILIYSEKVRATI